MISIIENTPWQTYSIKGRKIYVKREDLCCPFPGPSFSKIRGVKEKIKNLKNNNVLTIERLGAVDTRHSKAGWGVSYIAKHFQIPCSVYYPKFKDEKKKYIRPYQIRCQGLGAEIIPIPATMSAVLYNKAKSMFMKKYPSGYMFPNGLKLPETVKATTQELIKHTPKELLKSDALWVVSISSGTIAAGILAGLMRINFKGEVYLHEGYSRPINAVNLYLSKMTHTLAMPFKIKIIDEGYQYKDKVDIDIPFPCNPYYDAKAWKWMSENIDDIDNKKQIIFWNIGS